MTSLLAYSLSLLVGVAQAAPEPAAPADAAPAESPPVPDPSPALPVPALPAAAPPAVEPASEATSVTGLEVVGQRRRREKRGSVHSVGEEQLERLNLDDPHAVLNAVPGVYTRGEDGVGLRPNIGARGVNPDRSKKVTLTEDGVLFGPAPYSAPAAYYFPLITRMHELEVLKGPATLGYGPQTVAGAVNLLTRPIPESLTAGLDLGVGQYMYGKGHGFVGGTWDRFAFLLEGVHLRTDGWKQLDGGGDTGFTRNEAMLKARYSFNPGAAVAQSLQLKLGYSDEDSQETYLGLTTADFAANPRRRYRASMFDHMKWDRTQAELRHVIESENFELHTVAYRHDFSRVWKKVNGLEGASIQDVLRQPDGSNAEYLRALRGETIGGFASRGIIIGPNDRSFVSQGIQSQGEWHTRFGKWRNRLQFSARLHHDRARRVHSEDIYQFENGQLLLRPGQMTNVTADDTTSTVAVSLYAADSLTIDRLTVQPGLRAEIIDGQFENRRTGQTFERNYSAFLPGLGAHYRLWKGLGAVAGVYRGFSPVSLQQPGADPETSTNFESGLRYEGVLGRAELMGFWNEYDNLTAICTESAGCQGGDVGMQTDAGEARSRGLEAFAQMDVRRGQTVFPLVLAYTFTDARFLSGFASSDPIFGTVTAGDRIPYIPRHQLNLMVGVERPRWGLTLTGLLVGAMQDSPRQGSSRTDTLATVDVGGHVKLPHRLQVYLTVRNVLDQAAIVSYRPFGARPNSPRWTQVGLRWGF